jgi:2,4-dienoyl-CoA reductase-like NADH-dependent reductase (Old Yellow Enzyme family)
MKSEIKELTRKFAYAAKVAKETGFTGVQLHSAHGYLLSSFLSPLANQRKDEYGGTLKNRCRFLMETIAAVRREVGTDYPIAVKLNSADFQRGGFTHEEAIQVARYVYTIFFSFMPYITPSTTKNRWLDQQSLDLLEISGGNYENPVLLLGTGGDEEKKKTSTELREVLCFLHRAFTLNTNNSRTKCVGLLS